MYMNNLFSRKRVLFLLVALFSNKLLFAQSNFFLLGKQVKEKKYTQAWQQAERLVANNEGDPLFDYLYGISALETGHYDKAVFALERVIVNQPNVIRPRLELARAYLKIKNDQAALREFKQVLALNPPASVQRNVNQYIQMMRNHSKGSRKWVINGLITLAAGYDTNANFGTNNADFNVPVFGSIKLKDASLKQSSSFIETRGSVNAHYIVSDTQSFFLNSNIGYKHFSRANEFDLSDLNIQVGYLFSLGKQQYQLSLQHQTLQLNNKAFSNTLGLEAGITKELAGERIFATSLSVEKYNHQQQNLRDAQRYQLLTQYGFKTGKIQHRIKSLLGSETAKNKAGKYHTRNSIGVAYSANHQWNAKHGTSFSAQLQRYKHRGKDPIYNIKRKDTRLLLKIAHSVLLTKDTSAFVDIGYIKNGSNLGLYKTNKTFARVGINYRF